MRGEVPATRGRGHALSGCKEHEEIEGEEENERASGEEHEHAEMVDAAEDAEHHEVAKERLKRKEFEIFIGGLDKDAVEDDLRKIFSQVGEIGRAHV